MISKNKKKRAKGSMNFALFFLFVMIVIDSLVFFFITKTKMQIINFDPLTGPIVNPLMGLAPWANSKKIKQPHTLVYVDLTWKDFEPQEGVYDFIHFEEKQQLSYWRQEGDRVVFRFVTDFPGEAAHKDIPDWLFDKINGDGEYYSNEYGQGFSPNYSNPIFIKYHYLALKALGDRYGKDGFFAFIELGSLGHWGEWHVSSDLGTMPPGNIRDLYVFDYKNAFPDTYLLMRRPFSIAKKLNLGLYNDQTGYVDGTNTWLDWIENGGDYQPDEKNSLVPMPDGWKNAPIGGEQATNLSDEELYRTHLDTTLQLLKDSHTTFIGPGGPYDIGVNDAFEQGVNQVLSTIGYRIYLSSVEVPVTVKFGKEVTIKLGFSNAGVAPFYYEWPAKLYLYDEKETEINSYPFPVDLRKILPGQVYNVPFVLPVDNLPDGKYKLGFAIFDPQTGRPGIKLANKSLRTDLIQEAGSFEVKWLFSFLKK